MGGTKQCDVMPVNPALTPIIIFIIRRHMLNKERLLLHGHKYSRLESAHGDENGGCNTTAQLEEHAVWCTTGDVLQPAVCGVVWYEQIVT